MLVQNSKISPQQLAPLNPLVGLVGFLTALGFAVCVLWACSAIVASGNAQGLAEDFHDVAWSKWS